MPTTCIWLQVGVEICHQGCASGFGQAQEVVDSVRPCEKATAAPYVPAAIPEAGREAQYQQGGTK